MVSFLFFYHVAVVHEEQQQKLVLAVDASGARMQYLLPRTSCDDLIGDVIYYCLVIGPYNSKKIRQQAEIQNGIVSDHKSLRSERVV